MPEFPCQRCGSAAVRLIKLVAGGKVVSVGLCANCAPDPLFNAPLPATAAGLTLAIPLPKGRSRCPACGFRWSDFERVQRLGCPACYESHAEHALPLVARNQPALEHVGRRPGTPVAPLQRELEGLAPSPPSPSAPTQVPIEELEARLARAVKEEDYEEAARIRDTLAARRTQGAG